MSHIFRPIINIAIVHSTILLITSLQPSYSKTNEKEITKHFALFFAVSDYQQSPSLNLSNPIRDAEALAGILSNHYNFDTLIYRNPTKARIEAVLRDWQEKFESINLPIDSELLVFFSGHGNYNSLYCQSFFMPSNAIVNSDAYQIELTGLSRSIVKINIPHILISIDACYSGGIDNKILEWDCLGKMERTKGHSSIDKHLEEINLIDHLKDPSRLFVSASRLEPISDGLLHAPFASSLMKTLESYAENKQILTFNRLVASTDNLSPPTHSGRLLGDKGGGFVFIPNTVDSNFTQLTIQDSITFNPSKEAQIEEPKNSPKFLLGCIENKEKRVNQVKIYDQEGNSTISDSNGCFKLPLNKADYYRITFRKKGYEPKTINFYNINHPHTIILNETK